MWTPNDLAYAIAAIAWESRPQSLGMSSLMNFNAMIETLGATPTTPIPFSDAAIVPATWVPWPSWPKSWTRVVVVAEVPAVDVVDVAVAVVVDAVGLATAARFAGVRPGAVGKVRVAEVDAVIDDRDDRRRVAGRDAERLAAVDVGIGRALGRRDRR